MATVELWSCLTRSLLGFAGFFLLSFGSLGTVVKSSCWLPRPWELPRAWTICLACFFLRIICGYLLVLGCLVEPCNHVTSVEGKKLGILGFGLGSFWVGSYSSVHPHSARLSQQP